MVLVESFVGVADGANQMLFEVSLATYVVDDFVVDEVEEHSIDGEVAAKCVLACVGEDYFGGSSSVVIGQIGTECGNLDLALADEHNNYAKLGTDSYAARKKFGYRFWCGVGGNVIIVWDLAEQHIANTAAGEQGLVASLVQTSDNPPDGSLGGHWFGLGLTGCGTVSQRFSPEM